MPKTQFRYSLLQITKKTIKNIQKAQFLAKMAI